MPLVPAFGKQRQANPNWRLANLVYRGEFQESQGLYRETMSPEKTTTKMTVTMKITVYAPSPQAVQKGSFI